MQVFGNVEALKRAVEKNYSSKIKEIQADEQKQLVEIGKELQKRIDLLRSHMKTETNAAAGKAYSAILSSEKLKAKKEFEEKREALIEKVFMEAAARAKKIAHSERYINYIKTNKPEGKEFTVIGDCDYYKPFFPQLKDDKTITGVKFQSESVIYDFTLDNLIASKKDILRKEVSDSLFKQK